MYLMVHRDSEIGKKVRKGEEVVSVFPDYDYERLPDAVEAMEIMHQRPWLLPVHAEFSGKYVIEKPNKGRRLFKIRGLK
jgi:hypothetical protein